MGPAEARQSGRRRRAEDPRLSSCATGVPGLNDNLAPVASMVEDRAAVHRFDQRGSGRSTGSAPFVVSDLIEGLEALRVHWRHESWIVGGHSWGGWLAFLYALAHPDRVSGLIGIGVPPMPGEFHHKYRSERARVLRQDHRETQERRGRFAERRTPMASPPLAHGVRGPS